MTDKVMAHHLMRASLASFQCRFDQLTLPQKQMAENVAQNAMTLETAVLSSREASAIHVPQTMIGEALSNVRERYQTQQEFEQDLNANALDLPTLTAALERELKVDAVLEKVAQSVEPINAEEARHWYDDHPDKFAAGPTRTVRHILITINDDFPENQRGRARLKIQSILEKLDGTSQQFQQLARQHSECPTALEGGLLGNIPKGKLFTSLDETLFAMERLETSDVLESEMGFHILFCEDIQEGATIPFAQVKQKIADHLFASKKHAAQKRWIAQLPIR